MPREFAIAGMLIPGLLPLFVLSLIGLGLLDHLFARLGVYRHAWHPALLRVALFVAVFAGAGLLLF